MIRFLPLLALLACGAEPAPDAPHDHGDGTHTHGEGAPHAHPTTATDAAAGHDADHHASGSGHMADMAATREKLRTTLGAAYDAPVAGLDAADPAKGKAAYDRLCASCHGPGGKGDGPAGQGLKPPPADFTDGFHARWYSDAGRVHIIREGIEGTAMTGFSGQLSDAELLDLYAYVRSLRPAPTAAPAGHDHGAPGDAPEAHDHGEGSHQH